MNILLLGSGGREHALAWKMAASPLTDRQNALRWISPTMRR
jgi:phosphoribosylamine-glycine ligase